MNGSIVRRIDQLVNRFLSKNRRFIHTVPYRVSMRVWSIDEILEELRRWYPYVQVLNHPVMPAAEPRPTPDTKQLEARITELTRQIRLQNQFGHRFLMGIVVGVGTALGATVVATLLLLMLRPLLTAIGLDSLLP